MKKVLVFLSLILCFAFTGCSGTVALNFDSNRPWRIFSASTSACAEKMEYKVEIYDGTINDLLLTDESSSYVVSLVEGITNVGTETTRTATVDTTLTVKYRDDINTKDSGLIDVIKTQVIFRLDNLSTIYSSRKVILADRAGVENNSYEVVTDYVEKIASIVYHNGTNDTMKLKVSSPMYDNEMLFYLVRSLSTIKEEKSDMFKIANTYESFIRGKFATYSMKQVTEDLIDVEVNKDIYDLVSTANDAYEKQDDQTNQTRYYLTCYRTQIGLNASKSGPSFYSYMSRGAFSKNGTNTTYKVPVALVNYLYDMDGETTRTQICTLVNYSSSGNYAV